MLGYSTVSNKLLSGAGVRRPAGSRWGSASGEGPLAPRSPTERAANADDVEDAKLFIEWLFSSDDNLHDLADIDKKTTLLLALPTVSGIELDFDTSQLMEEDLTKFGSAREATLAKWDKVTSGKKVVSSK